MTNPIMSYKEAETADNMAEDTRKGAWNTLVDIAVHNLDYENILHKHECAYMEEMYGDLPEAKKADGSWKFRKFKYKDKAGKEQIGGLPAAYSSAKSTIKQAYENPVPLIKGSGEARPKTEVGKAIREAKAAKQEVNKYDEAVKLLEKLKAVWPELSGKEQEILTAGYGRYFQFH